MEGRPRGPSRQTKRKNSEIGGELRSPEEFPHGNLTHASVAKKRAPKTAELGGPKKNTEFQRHFTAPENENSKKERHHKLQNWVVQQKNANFQRNFTAPENDNNEINKKTKTQKQVEINEATCEKTKEHVNHHGTASWGTDFKN